MSKQIDNIGDHESIVSHPYLSAKSHGDVDPFEHHDIGPGAPEKSPGQEAEASDPRELVRQRIGLVAGVLVAALIYWIMPQDSTTHEMRSTAAIAALMGVWWMTEAIPIPITALLPLVLFPAFNVAKIKEFSGAYTSSVIFLFMGGFMLALAMQRWNLHRRISLHIVKAMGTSSATIILGFMIATGFLSMWVSNTATAVMMLPIGVSVLTLINNSLDADKRRELGEDPAALDDSEGGPAEPPKTNFGIALMLGIAYAASIGSLGTIIGTPPNTLLAGYMADQGHPIGFGEWMLVGVPLAVVLMLVCWFVLVKVLFKPEVDHIPGGREMMDRELKAMGSMSTGEKLVGVIFVLAAISWIGIPLLFKDTTFAGNFSAAVIAMVVGILLFIIPADLKKGTPLLDWHTALELPWGVLLLFGGGLALSKQFSGTGLSEWIGTRVGSLDNLPIFLLILVVAGIVLILTEFTSNTATAATFLPVVGGVAVGLGMNQMYLAIPVALAATSAFMLPVATPPNAIAYGSGYVSMNNMVKTGVWLNIIALVLITALVMTIGVAVFDLNTPLPPAPAPAG
ncbi:DASS family sodium-coupled anion symporter [Corynebacterium sp. P7003]|uniref:Sodium-dependent dicarboxylate transporter SdcS n=1 Tax=Corynebacterium pygosceleis TaxID=2800406 RepID=A0ABT3WT97_9CORY|nr:DASS family sodium-coupled anion symporter [Corynebacterium pygosceleis]MCX7445371.1 DASS family sodium-coupled anion symporter [Corynebacterium pygosceleis]